MSIDEVMNYFKVNYPDLVVIKTPEINPTEIIAEIDPTADHPNYSMAVAAIRSSAPHYHKNTEEEYEVLSGTLLVRVGDVVKTIYEHEKLKIPARQVHSATSVEGFALVAVKASPGWRPEDHFLVDSTSS